MSKLEGIQHSSEQPVMDLSIGLLVYRCNPLKLISELLEQSRALSINFEVLVYDDGSGPIWQDQLKADLEPLPEVFLHLSPENHGRSYGRNLLASKALGDYILMMDGDNLIDAPHFVNDYYRMRKPSTVVVGGRKLIAEPLPGCELRWLFAKNREIQSLDLRKKHPFESFQTNCFLADRQIFEKVQFDTRLETYGYEDNLFGFDLQRAGFSILHIQNPQYHSADDRNLSFLAKTEEAMESLLWIEQNRPEYQMHFKLLKLKHKLETFGIKILVFKALNLVEKSSVNNLKSSSPSLWRFDLFRLHRLLLLDLRD